jgi:hypothetical protein
MYKGAEAKAFPASRKDKRDEHEKKMHGKRLGR